MGTTHTNKHPGCTTSSSRRKRNGCAKQADAAMLVPSNHVARRGNSFLAGSKARPHLSGAKALELRNILAACSPTDVAPLPGQTAARTCDTAGARGNRPQHVSCQPPAATAQMNFGSRAAALHMALPSRAKLSRHAQCEVQVEIQTHPSFCILSISAHHGIGSASVQEPLLSIAAQRASQEPTSSPHTLPPLH